MCERVSFRLSSLYGFAQMLRLCENLSFHWAIIYLFIYSYQTTPIWIPLSCLQDDKRQSYICNEILFNLGNNNISDISLGMFTLTVKRSEVCHCCWARLKQEIIFPDANNIPCWTFSLIISTARSRIAASVITLYVATWVWVVNIAISLIEKMDEEIG